MYLELKADISHDPLSLDLLQMIQDQKPPLAIVGPKALDYWNNLKEDQSLRFKTDGWQHRYINFFVSPSEGFTPLPTEVGPVNPDDDGQRIAIVLATHQGKYRKHKPWVATEVPWRVSLLKYLMHVVNDSLVLPSPSSAAKPHLLYIPHDGRLSFDVLRRVGQMLTRVPSPWQMWFQTPDVIENMETGLAELLDNELAEVEDQSRQEEDLWKAGVNVNSAALQLISRKYQETQRKIMQEERRKIEKDLREELRKDGIRRATLALAASPPSASVLDSSFNIQDDVDDEPEEEDDEDDPADVDDGIYDETGEVDPRLIAEMATGKKLSKAEARKFLDQQRSIELAASGKGKRGRGKHLPLEDVNFTPAKRSPSASSLSEMGSAKKPRVQPLSETRKTAAPFTAAASMAAATAQARGRPLGAGTHGGKHLPQEAIDLENMNNMRKLMQSKRAGK